MTQRFRALAEVEPPLESGRVRVRVLMLADDLHAANVVQDHINAIAQSSRLDVTIINPIHSKALPLVRLVAYDIILIHYSIYILGEYFLPPEWARAVRRFKGRKAQIIQDEHRHIEEMKLRMKYLGVTSVFSSLELSTMRQVYSAGPLGDVSFYSCLPGYISPRLHLLAAPPIAQRKLHVAYRGRSLPAHLGQHSQDKQLIGEQLLQAAPGWGLKVDISSDESARIYGANWDAFLTSAKATLGVEGGASIFDFEGSIEAKVASFRQDNPDAGFSDIWREVLSPYEGNVVHKTITPKLLEAIAAKTALVLYPGLYRGVLKAWDHYIPLERDGTNLTQVMQALLDDVFLEDLTSRTHEEIMGREELQFRYYVERIERVLATDISPRSLLERLSSALTLGRL